MTQEEMVKKAYEIFPERKTFDSEGYPVDYNHPLRGAYLKGLSEFEDFPKICGWVAREDVYMRKGRLLLFRDKPLRDGNYGWKHDSLIQELDSNLFSDLKWIDEPIEVEMFIRKK